MSLTLDELKTLDRLYQQGLDLPAGARLAWIDSLLPEHSTLAPILRADLLAGNTDAGIETADFLRTLPKLPLAQSMADASGALINEPAAGERVGPYQLVRRLGEGGMSSVWLAQRADGTVKREVALKLPHRHLLDRGLAERMRRERDILAGLNHDAIARLYDAGIDGHGRPYLALEYVVGKPIHTYCAANGVDLAARVRLMVQAVQAVAHAHANLVVHRDLKPNNILVTTADKAPRVKLLDFGIGKLLTRDDDPHAERDLTQTFGNALTPDYASPEQVLEQPVTTASDIYSLGVVLYEVVTGEKPYKLKHQSAAALAEAITRAKITLPSRRSALGKNPGEAKHISGDLDAIILKALKPQAAERYATASALADDLKRYLAHQPVLAQPDSWAYRARRYVRRNALAVGAATAVSAALLLGTGLALWQARVAVRQANKADAVQSFLTELFEKSSRMQTDAVKSRSKTVREVVVEASERLGKSFNIAPELRAELAVMLARLLNDVDEFERATTISREAIALIRANGLEGTDLHVKALIGVTTAARFLGKAKDALEARDEAIAVLDARGDRTSLLRALASTNSLSFLASDPAREIQLTHEALTLFEQRYPTHPERFSALVALAQVYRSQGQWTSAEQYFREAITLFPKVGAKDYLNFAAAHTWAGFCAARLGRTKDALRDYETGIRLLRENAGDDALVTRFHRGLYALSLHRGGYSKEAHREWGELRRTVVPAKPTVVDFDNSIYEAQALVQEGRPRLAVARLYAYSAKHVEFGKRFYPNGVHWATLLALAHAMQGYSSDAETALQRIDDLPHQYSIPPQQLVDYKIDVTWILLSTGRLAEAAAALQFGEDHTVGEYKVLDENYVRANLRAAEIAARQGDAARAREHSQRALDHLAQRLAPGAMPWLEAEALKTRGNVLLAARETKAALQALEAAIVAMRRLHDPASPWLAEALVSAARAHQDLGQKEQAAALLAEARRIVRKHPSLSPVFTQRWPPKG